MYNTLKQFIDETITLDDLYLNKSISVYRKDLDEILLYLRISKDIFDEYGIHWEDFIEFYEDDVLCEID